MRPGLRECARQLSLSTVAMEEVRLAMVRVLRPDMELPRLLSAETSQNKNAEMFPDKNAGEKIVMIAQF